MQKDLIIVGGSYAACEIAGAARDNGFDGAIRILTEERELPYHRPPLSKAFLLGTAREDGLPLKGEKFYRDRNIEVSFATRVTAIDKAARAVTLADGSAVKFDLLALAVGARNRALPVPGADLAGVLYLRSIEEARALKQAAALAGEVVVIGGGFIGLEVASALSQHGKKVTVVEAAPHVLNRVVAPQVSEFFAEAHRAQGVTVRTGAQVVAIRGDNGRARQVVLADGSAIDADLVVVGIGSVANSELAAAVGLACPNGILVDRQARTAEPTILAAGDCAFFAGPYTGEGMRLESVQNALDQARIAGATAAGKDKVHDALPWFWSDQFKLKLQIAGISAGHDSCVVRPGGDGSLAAFYFRGETCIAVDSVNRPRDHMAARRVLPGGVSKRKLLEFDYDLAALMKAAS